MAARSDPKRVVIVGAGAAGMACAAKLAQHPQHFKVTILERAEVTGGQATSIPINEDVFGAAWMNNGVQGGSPIFKHTFDFFEKYGHPPKEVELQVSFGKGTDGFWTNCFPSTLVERFPGDIKKFGRLLQLVKWTMPILGLVPIWLLLRVMLFRREFADKMVYPLIALFLGTGNQTPNVPSAIVERLFDDPNMKLWDYDAETLLPNRPKMVTFGNLGEFYRDWAEDLTRKGVEIRLNTEVVAVTSRSSKGIRLQTRPVPQHQGTAADPPVPPTDESYDELVLCTLADDSLRLLGRTASLRERLVLGGARFYDDVTVTHSDAAYFARHYEVAFDPALCAPPHTDARRARIAVARGDDPDDPRGFKPMYFTKSYAQAGAKIEMSFDCSNYQHQLLAANTDPRGEREHEHVYQSIFLDSRNQELWTWNEIDETKVIQRKWWHQLGHRWQHYLRVVPLMMFLQGRHRTWFAGSWTLVNMHELACVSGIAAAYRLGAEYREFDGFATDFFAKYLMLSHGVWYSREEKRRRTAKNT